MSDVLVVYYSRTGKTRMLAEKLATPLGAELQEIREEKDRSGILGYLSAALDSLLGRRANLTHAPDPAPFKTIVIGAPIWTGRVTAPVRAYVEQVDLSGKSVCAFTTSDLAGGKHAHKELSALLPVPLARAFNMIRPKANDAQLEQTLAHWAGQIVKAGQ